MTSFRPCYSAVLMVLLSLPVASAQTRTWVQSGSDGFREGTRTGVVLSSHGELRLGRAVQPLVKDNGQSQLVSAVAEAPDRTIYYGTSLPGQLYALKPGDTQPTLVRDLGDETLITSILVDPAGKLLVAASGESARLLRFAAADAEPKAIALPEEVRVIWALLALPGGDTYIATGPDGKLFALPPDSDTPRLAFDFEEDNLLCLAAGPDKSLYIGTDPRGRVYRLPAGEPRPTVVFDAAEPEITALSVGKDRQVFVSATSPSEDSEPDETSGSSRGHPDSDAPSGLPSNRPAPGFPEPPAVPGQPPSPSPRAPGASAAPSPWSQPVISFVSTTELAPEEPEIPAGGSALYLIDPEGFATELYRAPVAFHCMLEADGVILLGTGGNGSVFQVDPLRDEAAEVARLDAADVTVLLRRADLSILVATGNGPTLSTLSPGPAAEGTFTSSVLSAPHAARLGTLRLDGTLPQGSSAVVSTRSGNTAEPSDLDWSAWTDPVPAERFVKTTSPVGRYAQYRLTFRPSDTGQSPVLREVEWSYRVPNLAPRITSLVVSPPETTPAAEPGTESPPKPDAATLLLSWEAEDANADTMLYALEYRPVGDPDWRPLRNKITETTFDWSTREVPEGRYQVRVLADDAPSNPEGESRRSARVSGVILVDHAPPVFTKPTVESGPDGVTIRFQLQDSVSAIRSVAFRVGAEPEWRNVDAGDKLFDSPSEDVIVVLRNLGTGKQVVRLRATDANGNEGFETVVVEGPAGK